VDYKEGAVKGEKEMKLSAGDCPGNPFRGDLMGKLLENKSPSNSSSAQNGEKRLENGAYPDLGGWYPIAKTG